MRRILVVSPQFPPSDAAEMHRVRMTVGYYQANGWDPAGYYVSQWGYQGTQTYGGIKVRHRRADVRSATVSADRRRVFLELLDLREGEAELLDRPGLVVDQDDRVAPAGADGGDDPVIVREGPARHPEDPLWVGQLGGHRGDRLDPTAALALDEAIEVPPAAPLGDEVDEELGLALGAVDYIVKPIKPKASRDKSSETFLIGMGLKHRNIANP